jgi:predicted transcriptional regulator
MPVKPLRPTEAELGILQVLWQSGPSSVRDVQRILNEKKPTGYTTALKLMQIMTGKGILKRDDTVRPQIYYPRDSQQQTQHRLMKDLLDRAFGGSVKELVLQALATRKSTPQELEAIEQLLNRSEGAGQ